jgi:hypothetical protein
MRAPLLRYLAVIALAAAALVGSQAPAPAAAEPTASIGQAQGCVDGVKTTKVNLVAADAQDTTFTITVTRDVTEVFQDADRVVPAGTSEKVSIPGLTYGSYVIRVVADGEKVLGEPVYVGCPPVGDYKNTSVSGFHGCDGETVLSFSNRPIRGAEGELLPAKFAVFDDAPGGTTTVFTVTLPDGDKNPYDASVRFERGEYPKSIRITVDGTEVKFWPISAASCRPPEPPLPNTGG